MSNYYTIEEAGLKLVTIYANGTLIAYNPERDMIEEYQYREGGYAGAALEIDGRVYEFCSSLRPSKYKLRRA